MSVFSTDSTTHSDTKAVAHNNPDQASANENTDHLSIQAKLKIGQPNDPYEQEADQMAEQVMRMEKTEPATVLDKEPILQQKPLADQITPLIQKEEEETETVEEVEDIADTEEVVQEQSLATHVQRQEEEEEQDIELQAKEDTPTTEEELIQEQPLTAVIQREEEEDLQKKPSGEDTDSSQKVEKDIQQSRGHGEALSSNTLQEMNNAFGADFSGVTIHNDSQAGQLSQQLQAKAFTVGNDIYFNSGQYDPDSGEGKRLLAHELTHTVQQGASESIQRSPQEEKEDPAEAASKKFLSNLETEISKEIRSQMSAWAKERGSYTPQEYRTYYKEVKTQVYNHFNSLLTDDYIRAHAGVAPEVVRAYLEEKKQELESESQRRMEMIETMETYPEGFEETYQDLVNLVEKKIKGVEKLARESTDPDIKLFYQAQLKELQASERLLDNDIHKKYVATFPDYSSFLNRLTKTINEFPLPINQETLKQDTSRKTLSANIIDSWNANPQQLIHRNIENQIGFDPLVLASVFEGEAIDEIEDPELSDDKIAEEEQEEELKEFLSRLQEIATPDESAEGNYQLFMERLKKMTPQEREQFLEYLKGLQEQNPEEEETEKKPLDASKALEDYSKLSELDKKVLDTNRKLRQDSTNSDSKNITIDFGDLETPVDDQGRSPQEVLHELSQAESILNEIKRQTGLKGDSLSIDLGWSPFLTEMSVFYALLAGAGKRSTAVKELSKELMANLQDLKKKITGEVLESGALSVAAAAAGPIGAALGGAKLAIKLNKVRKLIEAGEKVYEVGTKFASFIKVVQDPKLQEALENIEAKFQQIEALERKLSAYSSLDDEALEDELFELEEQLREDLVALVTSKGDALMEFLYIPEPEDGDPEAIVDELLKVLYDMPKGLKAFEAMSQTYMDLNAKGNPSKEELASLSLEAVTTGVYLYPFVGFLADEANNALNGLGKADLKAVGGRRKKKKQKPGNKQDPPKTDQQRKDERKENTKKKFAKLDRNKYEYTVPNWGEDYLNKYKKLYEGVLHNKKNALYDGYWTPGYFKYLVRDQYKDYKKLARRDTVKAKVKGSKKGPPVDAPAPAFKLIDWSLQSTPFSFKLKVNPNTPPITTGSGRPLNYAAFAGGTGIPYTFSAMGSTDHKRIKKKELKKWLQANGYQFTYEVDGTGSPVRNEAHLHIRRGKTKDGYLHLTKKGFIKQGLDKSQYKNFLGKQIAKEQDLPEGYLRVLGNPMAPNPYTVRRKSKTRDGLPKLSLDGKLLMEGPQPPVARPIKPLGTPDIKAEGIAEGFDYKKSIRRMFDQPPGKPEVPKAGYHMQGRNTIANWESYLDNHKHDQTDGPKQRPKRIEADFGYIVNARADGDDLGKYDLTELKNADDKGHLIARRFGAKEYFNNLIPMDRTTNQKGDWAKVERAMAQKYIGKNAIAGNYVHTIINIHYSNNDTRRPTKFDINWKERKIRGGDQPTITNPDGTTRIVSDSKSISNR